jgi:spermidine/putrescine transport system substrate-binding protein
MLSLINSVPPGTYDVVLVDREYIPQLRASDKLQLLNADDYPFGEFFPEAREIPELAMDKPLYAVPLRMNYLGLSYNSDYVSADEASSYKALWDPKLKGKVGWFDWYLPSMGVLSLYNGNKRPFDISNEEFARLKETLFSLQEQTSGFYGHADIQTAFANGNCYALAGNGDSSSQILKSQGLPIETRIPKEGALGVVEALGIPNGSANVELAKNFIQYATSAEGQFRSALLPAYVDYVPSMPAWQLLAEREPDWATRLRMRTDQHPNIIDDLKEGRISFRETPVQQSIEDWNQVWTEFKSL